MTGAEHYEAAESALGLAQNDLKDTEREAPMLASAQVHATLALTAATMQQHHHADAVTDDWAAVLS
jgi:hypothetical protein